MRSGVAAAVVLACAGVFAPRSWAQSTTLDTLSLRQWMAHVAGDAARGRALATPEHLRVIGDLSLLATGLGLRPLDSGASRGAMPLTKLSTGMRTSLAPVAPIPRPQLAGVDIIPLHLFEWGLPQRLDHPATQAKVVFAGAVGDSTTASSYKGEIVLVEPPRRPNGLVEHDVRKYLDALDGLRSARAIGIIGIEVTPLTWLERHASPRFELSGATFREGWPPIFLITQQAASAVLSANQSLGRLRIEIEAERVVHAPKNLVMVLDGSDPVLRDEYVVLSAPSDHLGVRPNAIDGEDVFTGADDGGSGMVALLGVAQRLLAAEVRPKRSIIFVWHAGTEHGLLGSEWLLRDPPVARERIVGVLNVDRIARGGDTLYAVGDRQAPSPLAAWVNAYASATGQLLDWSWDAAGEAWQRDCSSDHVNYRRAGIPALTINSGLHEDWRRPTDTIERIDFARYAERVTWLAGLVRDVADQPRRPLPVQQPQPLTRDCAQ